jgi:putative iron-dependent peroxidase
MDTPQSGIFALGAGLHTYLEFELLPERDPAEMARLIANLGEPGMTTGGVNLVIGFRPSLWARLAPDAAPTNVGDFTEDLRGADGFTMPATQRDLWVWVAGHAYSTVYDVARNVMGALLPIARLATEVIGWTYKESRDLTGFIDGTENPTLLTAPEVALIPDDAAGGGGSVLLVQQWVHDTAAFEALSVAEQEKIIGRTKHESIELDEEIRGATSHVSRTVIEEGGKELHIFRRNSPFGTATHHGTMFIGFSCEQPRLARMLARMAGAEDGVRDALTRFTSPITGSYYFVPSVEALSQFVVAQE